VGNVYDLAVRAVVVDEALKSAKKGELTRSLHARTVATENSAICESAATASGATKAVEKRLEE
jgi:hypothetical protein